jgi:hypothetical protein
MYSGSLQSTWDAQRSKQRSKLSNTYGTLDYGEIQGKMSASDDKAYQPKQLPTQSFNGMQNPFRTSADGTPGAELPNLKLPPQQVCRNTILFCHRNAYSPIFVLFLAIDR